ncbi:MAG: acetyltransferase [Oscillospiraceae bacterium]|nr:acetyltransferase [Oscillospiraceae bacterium]MDD6146956.1 acetyltransferase [Oscillospiraceae bacterium]
MKERLVIIGAGGHGKVIADIAMKMGYQHIVFLDDKACGSVMGLPVIGKSQEAPACNDGNTEFFLAIGDGGTRRRIAQQYPLPYATLIHPSAQIGYGVSIGEGTAVMAGAVINPMAQIGKHCIINTCAVAEHDNIIGDYSHLSPGALLAGTVHIGRECHIGIGASVKNNICICSHCVIGAGAAVVKNIEERGVYIGVPARKKE